MKSTFIFALLALGTLICATKAAPSSSEMQQDDGDMKKLLELIDRAARSQQDDDYDDADTNKLLQLLDRAAKSQMLFSREELPRSQQDDYDEDMALLQDMNEVNEQQDDDYNDETNAKVLLQLLDRAAQLQGDESTTAQRFLRKFGGYLRRKGPSLLRGAGRLAKKVLGGFLDNDYEAEEQEENAKDNEDMALLQDMNELNEQQDDDDIDSNKLLKLLDRAAKSQQFGDDDRAKAQIIGGIINFFKKLFG